MHVAKYVSLYFRIYSLVTALEIDFLIDDHCERIYPQSEESALPAGCNTDNMQRELLFSFSLLAFYLDVLSILLLFRTFFYFLPWFCRINFWKKFPGGNIYSQYFHSNTTIEQGRTNDYSYCWMSLVHCVQVSKSTLLADKLSFQLKRISKFIF